MGKIKRAIDEIEGGPEDTTLGTVRNVNEDLNTALLQPISVSGNTRRERDVSISAELNDHNWSKEDIRSVLYKRNHRTALQTDTNDAYFNDVLDEAGFDRHHHDVDADFTDSDNSDVDVDDLDDLEDLEDTTTDAESKPSYLEFSNF